MDPFTASLLVFCAALAGAINSVAGGGTFITFPVLIFIGMPPVSANITSTIALWPGSLASVAAYRRELIATRHLLPGLLIISVIGGALGALTLLYTPETVFSFLIPYLLLCATLLFTFGGRFIAWLHRHTSQKGWSFPKAARAGSIAGQFAIAFYGGYFGAGIGILMLALLELMQLKNIHEMNGLKTLLASSINGIAVCTFLLAGAVHWPQALIMLGGAVIGGYGGPYIARKLAPVTIRRFIIFTGLAMTAWFFMQPA